MAGKKKKKEKQTMGLIQLRERTSGGWDLKNKKKEKDKKRLKIETYGL